LRTANPLTVLSVTSAAAGAPKDGVVDAEVVDEKKDN